MRQPWDESYTTSLHHGISNHNTLYWDSVDWKFLGGLTAHQKSTIWQDTHLRYHDMNDDLLHGSFGTMRQPWDESYTTSLHHGISNHNTLYWDSVDWKFLGGLTAHQKSTIWQDTHLRHHDMNDDLLHGSFGTMRQPCWDESYTTLWHHGINHNTLTLLGFSGLEVSRRADS